MACEPRVLATLTDQEFAVSNQAIITRKIFQKRVGKSKFYEAIEKLKTPVQLTSSQEAADHEHWGM